MEKKTLHISKRSSFTVALVMMAAVLLTSCTTVTVTKSESPMTSKQFTTEAFHRIYLQGSPTVCYTQADTVSVHVEAPEDLMEYVVAEVKDSCLTIHMADQSKALLRHGRLLQGDEITVYVTSPDLTDVQLHGSGDFNSDMLVDTDNLTLDLHGSGTIRFNDIICDHLKTTLVGSGDVDVKHVVAATSMLELVGSGDIDINHDRVATTEIMLKGSGDVEASFIQCGQVTAELRGSGDIELKGNAQRLVSHQIGSGTISSEQLVTQ